jgi:hypothetical protein
MEYFSNFNSKDAQSITFEQLADLIRSDEHSMIGWSTIR